MEIYDISIFKVNKNIPCLETGLGLKLSSFLIYVLKNLSMLGVISQIPMLEKPRLLIL